MTPRAAHAYHAASLWPCRRTAISDRNHCARTAVDRLPDIGRQSGRAVASAGARAGPVGDVAPDVEIVGVTKRFGDVTAVDRMHLSIARGSFYSLLGPSGCGKTTTLRMIAGFEQPTEGEILLAGQPIAGVPPYRRHVNTVFQHYALFPHMDVAQNVGYGLRQQKVGPRGGTAPRQ